MDKYIVYTYICPTFLRLTDFPNGGEPECLPDFASFMFVVCITEKPGSVYNIPKMKLTAVVYIFII